MMVCRGFMTVGCLWDECVSCMCAASTEPDQWVSWGPVGRVRGPGCGQGCQVDRGAVCLAPLRGPMNVHVLVTLDSVMRVLH